MKDDNISTIKGIAILGVVLHHIANRRLDPTVKEWIAALPILFSWCVLAFFAVSGWLHALADEKRKRTFLEFAASRASRLLLPFVLLIVAYSLIWQAIQASGAIALRGEIPSTFLGKLTASLWPTGQDAVAEQLYFLPLLFGVSLLVQLTVVSRSIWPVLSLGLGCFIVGTTLFPHSENIGFTWGVFVWGCFSYVGGFLLFVFERSRVRLGILGGLLLVATAMLGHEGVTKLFPLLLLTAAPLLRFASWPLLPLVGEASGTIYAYHTPFILQPMMIAATKCHGIYAQFTCVLCAVVVAIAICTIAFHRIRPTRFHRILM